MKQLLELLPLVLFFGAYQMDGDTLTVGGWSHTFDGIFSATAVSYTHLTLPTTHGG